MRKETIERIIKFTKDRNWEQFHSPENLAKSISIEAAELLECFQWQSEFDLEALKDELADVLVYCYDLVHVLNLDVDEIVNNKMTKNELKYPVAKAYGKATKYDKLN